MAFDWSIQIKWFHKDASYFAHANVFHHDGKPVSIELSIATIPSDGSDPEVICITVNHAGLSSKPKDFRSICKENASLRLVHHPLPIRVPVEYLPFCGQVLSPGPRKQMPHRRQGIGPAEKFRKALIFTINLEMLPLFRDLNDRTLPENLHD
ncbi:hypothetical protein TNCV_4569511 [Trichonephila clavipes]|nr:hypothetical protein TNCV_4569511 [Trichonephila clavipes]